MPQVWTRYAVAGVMLAWMTGVSRAQLPPSHDAWLMRNYHFTGPPRPSELMPTDPVLTEIKEIQSTVRTILFRAKSEGDYESALAAAALAVSNAQLIGAITEHQRSAAQAPKSGADAAQSSAQLPTPYFLIALKDKTINSATSYWVDGLMLNYITLQGSHVMVRLDLVDRGLSRELNRQRNVEFHLPE